MELVIYNKAQRSNTTIEDFLEIFYNIQMKYLASDLFGQGLDYEDIEKAVVRAMKIAQSSGLKLNQHFKQVYSQLGTAIVKDCKLSELGYALVLINANPDNRNVAVGQLKILNVFLQS